MLNGDAWHMKSLFYKTSVILQSKCSVIFVIVISRLLKCYLKAKRPRVPAYSRALRRIKRGFSKGWSREDLVLFQNSAVFS